MTRPHSKWWLVVFGFALLNLLLGLAQGFIDRAMLAVFDPSYEPHREAARILGIPRALATLGALVVAGLLVLAWAIKAWRQR